MHTHEHDLKTADKDLTTGILLKLRALVPKDALEVKHHRENSEKQAMLLRKLLGVSGPMFPSDAISHLPRIEVKIEDNLPYSGSAHYDNKHWVITINSNEPPLRQRFSLAHEVKHIIDHTNKFYLYLDHVGITHNTMAEQQADYFAACLLMPKEHVKRLHKSGITGPTELAKYFQVSPRAMHIRMHQLKLINRWQRCKLRLRHRLLVLRLLIKVWNALPFPQEVKL